MLAATGGYHSGLRGERRTWVACSPGRCSRRYDGSLDRCPGSFGRFSPSLRPKGITVSWTVVAPDRHLIKVPLRRFSKPLLETFLESSEIIRDSGGGAGFCFPLL